MGIIQGLQLEFISNKRQSRIRRRDYFAIMIMRYKIFLKKSVIAENQVNFLDQKKKINKNRTYTLIRNFEELNEIIAYHHFEMELLQTSIQMITKGCNMALWIQKMHIIIFQLMNII